MGPAGAGSLAQVVNTAIAGKARLQAMHEFFSGVGEGDVAGIWQSEPKPRPAYRELYRRKLEKTAVQKKAEEMI
jgi:chlorophyllide a reductase subunit Y